MLVIDFSIHAVNVDSWVASRKRDPQKVVQGLGDKLAVINHHNQRKLIQRMFQRNSTAQRPQAITIGSLDGQDAWHHKPRMLKSWRQVPKSEFAWKLTGNRACGSNDKF